MSNEVKKLLLGVAGEIARVGAKAGLAAVDSAFGDAQKTARNIERRVRRARRKIAEAAERIAPRDIEDDEEEE